MKLLIKQCKYCPKMPDCEYKKQLKSEVRKALINVTVSHNCPVYRNIFQEGDEVMATPTILIQEYEYGEPNHKYGKSEESYRAVVINTPNSGKNNCYGVAFFEPIELWNGSDTVTKYILGMKANQLEKIGEYKGSAFWESGNYSEFHP